MDKAHIRSKYDYVIIINHCIIPSLSSHTVGSGDKKAIYV